MAARIDGDNYVRAGLIPNVAFRRASGKAARAGKAEALRRCPVGEGGPDRAHLWQTVRTETGRWTLELVAGDATRGVKHARFVEFGTSKMHPQPYMGPAGTVMRAVLMAELRRGIRL
jgi:HK97 gp10 family phage protein